MGIADSREMWAVCLGRLSNAVVKEGETSKHRVLVEGPMELFLFQGPECVGCVLRHTEEYRGA
jgi:hypothetical protein